MKQMEIKDDTQWSWSCFAMLRDRPQMNTEAVLFFRPGSPNTLQHTEAYNGAQMALPIDHVFVTTAPSIIQSTLLMCTKNHLKISTAFKIFRLHVQG